MDRMDTAATCGAVSRNRPYLPKDIPKAKGELATLDEKRIRYGVRHNEIARAPAMLIRYQLKLPAK